MTILSTLAKRSLGLERGNRQCRKSIDLSNVIEDFECLGTDEYIIVGHEDGSMVPPIACQFCKLKNSGNVAALVDENGYIVLYDTNRTGPASQVKEWQAHNNAVFDLSWMAGEEKLVTASGDQTAVLWDVTRGENISVFRGHTSSVRTVAFKPEDKAVFATGSRDGNIMIWDKRCSQTKDGHMTPVNTIKNAHIHKQQNTPKHRRKAKLGPPLDNRQSVVAVVFQSDMSLVSAGAGDGCVKIWDMRKNYNFVTTDPAPKHVLQYGGSSCSKFGFTSLVLDSTNSNLFVNCMDDVIYQYDVASMRPMPVCQYKGHRNSSFYVKASVSPDDQFLVSGSCDEMAYVWQINKPNKSPVTFKGHRAEVSDVAWSPTDMTKILTLSDDNTMRIWRLHRRLSPPGLEVTGTAERTHKEIGVSADATGLSPSLCRTSSLPVSETTPIRPKQLKKHATVGDSPNTTSPSITHWLGLSGKKTVICTPSSGKKTKSVICTPSSGKKTKSVICTASSKKKTICTPSSGKNRSAFLNSDKEDPTNKLRNSDVPVISNLHGSSIKSRPCKRKLVSDDTEENPSKRPHILKDLPSSPLKCANKSPCLKSLPHSKTAALFSPKKCPNSPRKLEVDADFGSPQTCCSPRKLTICKSPHIKNTTVTALNFNSPTVDLPNLVMSGEINKINVKCILGKENSPKKEPEIDWLTKLRLQKLGESAGEPALKVLPKRNLFDRNTVSPLRRLNASSLGNSQGSNAESLGNSPASKTASVGSSLGSDSCSQNSPASSQDDQRAKTPLRGMKPLYNYFQRQNSPSAHPGG